MNQFDNGDRDLQLLRDALKESETANVAKAPSFDVVWNRIMASPSAMRATHWSPSQALGAAVGLCIAQLRVVPWLIFPITLIAAGVATLVAKFDNFSQSLNAPASGFVSVILFSVVVTLALAHPNRISDHIAESTPIGPSSVLSARVTVILAVNAGGGFIASILTWSLGATDVLGGLVAAWLIPLVTISGLMTFLSMWISPWFASIVGTIAIPLLVPAPAESARIGMTVLAGAVQDAVPAVAMLGIGLLLLAAAIAFARRGNLILIKD